MREDRREQGVGATPQTLAKLKPDPVGRLARKGALSPDEEAAAYEIREAFAVVSGPVALRVSNPAAALRDRRTPRLPFENETERQVRLKRRYAAWRHAMAERALPLWPVLDVVIDELSCREADAKRGRRNGTTIAGLAAALDLYCLCCGSR